MKDSVQLGMQRSDWKRRELHHQLTWVKLYHTAQWFSLFTFMPCFTATSCFWAFLRSKLIKITFHAIPVLLSFHHHFGCSDLSSFNNTGRNYLIFFMVLSMTMISLSLSLQPPRLKSITIFTFRSGILLVGKSIYINLATVLRHQCRSGVYLRVEFFYKGLTSLLFRNLPSPWTCHRRK